MPGKTPPPLLLNRELRECRHCREYIQARARICRYCGSDQNAVSKEILRGFVVLVCILLGMASCHAMFGASSGSPAQETDQSGRMLDEERFQRLISCEVAMKADLDDPDSADFPNYLIDSSAYHAREEDGLLIEDFQFRAKNRWGGMQKMTGECLYKRGANGAWRFWHESAS